MILENWSALEIIAGILITAPFIYAWADRWLDRSRNRVTDKVESEKEE